MNQVLRSWNSWRQGFALRNRFFNIASHVASPITRLYLTRKHLKHLEFQIQHLEFLCTCCRTDLGLALELEGREREVAIAIGPVGLIVAVAQAPQVGLLPQCIDHSWQTIAESRRKSHSRSQTSSKFQQCQIYQRDGDRGSDERNRDPLGIATLAVLGGLFTFSSPDEEEKKDPFIYKLKRARLAEMKRNIPEADKLYHEALSLLYDKEATGEMGKKKALEAKVYIFDNMANIALAGRQIEKAEELFKDTLKGLLQLQYSKDDNAIIEISIKIAMCHALQQKYEEAEQGYKYCVDSMAARLEEARKMGQEGEELDPDLVALTGMSYDAYTRFLLVQKRVKEALKMSEKALELAKEVFGENHPQIAVLLSDKATSLTMMGMYADAEKYLQNAIEVAHSVKSDDLPVFYCNLGIIMLEQNKLSDSHHACKKAANLAEKLGNTGALNQAQNCLRRIEQKRKTKD